MGTRFDPLLVKKWGLNMKGLCLPCLAISWPLSLLHTARGVCPAVQGERFALGDVLSQGWELLSSCLCAGNSPEESKWLGRVFMEKESFVCWMFAQATFTRILEAATLNSPSQSPMLEETWVAFCSNSGSRSNDRATWWGHWWACVSWAKSWKTWHWTGAT